MKKNIVLAFALLGTIGAYAQTGIGTVLPDGTSMLDVASTTKGVLIPRVDLTSDTDIVTIKGGDYPESLIVYHNGKTGPLAGFYYWEKKKWNVLVSNTNLYEYIKKEAKQDTVLITQDNGDYIFTWKDDKGAPQTMRISEVIKKFETLTEFKGALDGTNEAVLTYKPERGAVSTVKLTELLKSSSVFEAYIKTLVGPGAGKTVVAKGTGIAVGESTAGTTTTYTVSAVPGEIILNGNVNGPLNASKVIGIQNVPVSATTPTAGQSLVYNQTASTWEPGKPAVSTGDITGKANLTTDGVIVVGDPAGAANTAANAVLAATTLSIKNESITGGKIALATITGGRIAQSTITGGNIASGTILTGNLIDKAVTVGKIADGGASKILTTTAAGVAQWEDRANIVIPKAPLTTDNVIVIGDAATGVATLADAVLKPTLLSIKNASITGGKIAANAVGSGHIADNAVIGTKIAANAINGNTHIINNSIPWGKMNNGNPSTILTTTAAGLLQWEPRATFITPRANLTTDGVIVIGDPAGAANTSAGAVMLATQLSIKNASITGAKIAANAINGGTHIINNSVPWTKMINGTVNSILTTSNNGSLEWQPKSAFTTTGATLTTSGGIIVGTTGAVSTAAGAVLTAVTISIQDGGVTSNKIATGAILEGKIADGAVTGTKIATGAVNTGQLASNSVTSGKIVPGGANSILTTNAAGVVAWELKTTAAPTITANNGLTKAGNNIELGGALAKTTTIGTSQASQLIITGLPTANIVPDNIVMRDATSGALRQANSAIPNFFYLPPINVNVTPGTNGVTLNVYNIYQQQYSKPVSSSNGATSTLPVYPAASLNFHVIYADPAVFTGVTINAAGVLTYSVKPNVVPTGATFFTVVLQVK